MSENTKAAQLVTGQIVTAKRDKTLKVSVERRQRHPLYGKVVTRRSTHHVHDPKNLGEEGKWVTIRQCRPISKTKTWELVDILGDHK